MHKDIIAAEKGLYTISSIQLDQERGEELPSNQWFNSRPIDTLLGLRLCFPCKVKSISLTEVGLWICYPKAVPIMSLVRLHVEFAAVEQRTVVLAQSTSVGYLKCEYTNNAAHTVKRSCKSTRC